MIFSAVTLIAAALWTVSAGAREVTVMTYNVHNGVGLDRVRDHARIAGTINTCKPEFAGIQEVDSGTVRSGNAKVLDDIATRTRMLPVFAPAIDFDGGRYGIGILSRTQPDSITRIPLPGREEKRMAVIAWYPDLVFVNTHLSLTPEDALSGANIILDAIRDAGRPVILTGDLNSLPDSEVIHTLSRDFSIVSPAEATFPANGPTERIDYIMVSRETPFRVIDAAVVQDSVSSDHRPVVVRLDLLNLR